MPASAGDEVSHNDWANQTKTWLSDMAFRSNHTWLLLPVTLVTFAFTYTALVFETFFWGYLGLMLFWCLVFLLGFVFVISIFPSPHAPAKSHVFEVDFKWDLVILLLGALAVLALFYDRYFLRGIDYFSVGSARARELLNQGNFDSSFFSVFGNFFIYCYLFPLIRSVLFWEERGGWTHLTVGVLAAAQISAISYLSGGRTAILITLSLCAGALVVRTLLGKSIRPAFFTFGRLFFLLVSVIAAFGFIFWLRSHAFGSGDSFAYFLNICKHLTNDFALECDFGVESGPLKDVMNYLNLVILYGIHGTWLTEAIVQNGWQGGWITPQGLFALVFSRFGVEAPPTVFSGFWVPGPAALLNDTGFWGVLGTGVGLGALAGYLVGYLQRSSSMLVGYALVFVVSFWFLSFLIVPTNIPGFVISVWLGFFLAGASLILTLMRQFIQKRLS
ncbi:hypothetical protein FMN52_16040 [Marinobacter sp. BW6]|uniref:hypothetical protein n=1 Tax=Marinobacter sp. BW6 TaxID=2592624 RepID=UPI0011DE7922|nr:hypothetical protein [Marinobacter sp. BW6]TYC58048.1 hypothetical protein FMN52_16040 [Marinobacter sp. BW6]